MNVLAVDTCFTACSAALLVGDTLHARFAPMERGHAEALFPMIRDLMAEAGIGFRDLSRIAVTQGPGTFTGVRAGLAAAHGIALACAAPLVTATSLEVMALGLRDAVEPARRPHGFLLAHDARRGELYAQLFDAEAAPIGEPGVLTPVDAAALLHRSEPGRQPGGGERGALASSPVLVAGSGAALVAAEAGRAGIPVSAILPDLLPEAAHLARLAATRAPSPAPVRALYLRAPDAKPQMDKHVARA